ncbi:MAG: hypothetical protein QOC73_1830 [Actinomycetota bacterium]|jgi:uncharacterized repeat protein (TIGR03847 family)|nr:hypothetical protein [Actinomycetota bacterium]MDQ1539653.1 hypothetical protein [Actinomycetota bacterium]
MPRQIFVYDPPERLVVGTVGQPGERTFFLQARSSGQLTSVVLEKVQVAALAERLDQLLDEVVRASGGTASVPAVAPRELEDTLPLEQPIVEEFRVGALGLGWDPETERVVVEALAVSESTDPEADDDVDDPALLSDDDAEGPDVLRVRITGGVARAFTKRALAIVAAGRPPCQFCGQPLDPESHVCARSNGHHPR